MGQDVADQDPVLAVPTERRPGRGDRLVEFQMTPLDLLPERDRGERLRPGEERERVSAPHRFAPYWVSA